MSIDSAIFIAWDVLKCIVAPIQRGFRYVVSSESYANNLREEVNKLRREAEGLHHAMEVARYNLHDVYNQATELQANSENALKEAQDLLDDFEKATKTCCYGTLPDPSCRYQFSKKAKHKTEDIKQLAGNCRELDSISYSRPPPGREGKDVVRSTIATASASSTSTSNKLRDDGIFESRASVIQEIMDALADNSNNVVGVHGMGGVGKSTLLVDAEYRIREKKLFDWVAKADVSENPDIRGIQGEIAYALGFDALKKEESIRMRADLLCKRLEEEQGQKKKVLIILDNLWKGLDLKLVGIPCEHDNKVIGCKLLLTSRKRDVLRREMGCDKDLLLGVLQEEEARRLFERMVGGKALDEEFKPWVDKALDKCAGVPFLILTMAKRFKDAELYEWKDTLRQVEMFKDKEINEVIDKMLQLSYNDLEEDAKSLLRLCVVYGVSNPFIEHLVRYGVGLGLFGDCSSIEEARDSLSNLIRTLQASSLLLENGEVGGFKIHDLVRRFVALVVSRDDPLLVLKENVGLLTNLPRNKLKSCTALCFPYVDMKDLPEELDCPEMRIFLLFTNNQSLKIRDSYFNSMRKLMVLHLSNISLIYSPLPFQFLKNLYTLCLDHCSLENVAILGELKGLHILSFANSIIHVLPKEIGQLVELRLLDLNNCFQLEIIEPGVLQSLVKLEELYMKNSFVQWNVVEQTQPTNASLIELNDMKNLCVLHVSIPNPSVLPEDLNVEKFDRYNIRIGNVWYWSEYKGFRTLVLKLNPTSHILQKGCIQRIVGKTDNLVLDGFEQSICALSQKGFPKLKHLQVMNSRSIHYILQSPSRSDFKTLESLFISNLISLEKLCLNHFSFKSFITLKVVQIDSCHKMEVLLPLSLVRGLPQLEEIKVVVCRSMRGIVDAYDGGKVELYNLHVLILRDLPNLESFFDIKATPSSSTSNDHVGTQTAFFNGQQISITSLESLTMEGLPNMKEIWSDESPLELSKLRSLKVVQCKSLSKVIGSKSVILLHKLHSLCIGDCSAMQEIFDLDKPNASGEAKTLSSKLTTLKLYKLGNLRCIWNKNPHGTVSFHNLKELEVNNCPNLRFIFFPSMVKSLAQLKNLMILKCKKMEAIIMEEEGLELETSETLAFPMLTNLYLHCLESLKGFSLGKRSRKAQSQDSVKSHSAAFSSQEVAFQRLETLEISGLSNIEFIFFPSMVESLTQLKKLTVSDCEKTEAFIMEEEGLGMETSEILAFPMLTHLHLKQLKSLMCFSRIKCTQESENQDRIKSHATALFKKEVAFPNLENLYIEGMDNIEMLWHDQIPTDSFSKLKLLSVKGCKKLVNVVPSFILGRFLSLETLTAEACDSLEVVFKLQPLNHLDGNSLATNLLELTELRISKCEILTEVISDEGGKEGHLVAFNQLKYMELDGLTRLRCFSSGGYTLMFSLLEDIIVNRCPKMKFFS